MPKVLFGSKCDDMMGVTHWFDDGRFTFLSFLSQVALTHLGTEIRLVLTRLFVFNSTESPGVGAETNEQQMFVPFFLFFFNQ